MPRITLINRQSIVSWHREGFGARIIQRKLVENYQVRCALSSIQDIIRKWDIFGTINNRERAGHIRAARTAENINAVRQEMTKDVRIGSPKRTPKRLALRLGVSKSSVRRILKFDIGLKPFKKQRTHFLNDAMKATRLQRCTNLLQNFGVRKIRRTVFSDETTFCIHSWYNSQNSRIYAVNKSQIPSYELLQQKKCFPTKIMVFLAVCYHGKLPPIFIQQGIRLNANNYQQLVLTPTINAVNDIYGRQRWVWQQDSAPCHSAISTQNFLAAHTPEFIDSNHWPCNSPDCSVLDFELFRF